MEEFKRNKVTIILVSHNLNAVAKFCDKCIWLQDGVIKSSGKSKAVIEEYLSFMSGKQSKSTEKADEKYTNEAALEEALWRMIDDIRFEWSQEGNSGICQICIAIPYELGCGLAGGNWEIIKKILEKIEKEYNVIFIAYKYEKNE